jgi:hypothetical protein
MKESACFATLAAVLAACSTVPTETYTSPGRLDVAAAQRAGDSIVVFSTGAPFPCRPTAADLMIKRRSGGGSTLRIPPISVDSFVDKCDFNDHHGFVHAIRLKPGTYEFGLWVMNISVSSPNKPLVSFEVRPGEVAYIGEFFLSSSCSLGPVVYDIRQSSARDLPLISAKNPLIDEASVVVRLMEPVR